MMKKYIKLLIVYVVLLGITCLPVSAKTSIKSGDTLASLKQELKNLEAKKAEQNNKKQQTQSQINANKKNMQTAENELENTKSEIASLTEQIEYTNEEIEKLKSETQSLMVLYQKLENENIYVSYITGASTMTELIMRMDAINQLTEYNEKKLKELELLISSNEKMNKELGEYQVVLDKKIVAYEASIEQLGDALSEIELGAVSIQEEIDSMKELIKYYQNIGCSETQELTACVSIANNSGWVKPVSKGRINSLYGYRSKPTANASSFHRGIDIGVSEGTKVYSTAAGTVGTIFRRKSCGGNMVYVWVYVNGKPYTIVFMHLLEIKVNVGDKVTTNTVIGLSGGGSTASRNGGYDTCTTGAHLHYGVASGGFYGKDVSLGKFNSNTMNPPGYPGLYQWFYTR